MNVSVEGVVESGIIKSHEGKVQLLSPKELDTNWNPSSDNRLSIWEIVHHLIRNLDSGEESAAHTFSKIPSELTQLAKELVYAIYAICIQKDWAEDAFKYNSLIQSWPEIERLASLEAPAQQGNF